jgi:hypothetical protein
MWDTTNLNLFSNLRKRHVDRCGIPHLAKNERDMEHPTVVEGKTTGRPPFAAAAKDGAPGGRDLLLV